MMHNFFDFDDPLVYSSKNTYIGFGKETKLTVSNFERFGLDFGIPCLTLKTFCEVSEGIFYIALSSSQMIMSIGINPKCELSPSFTIKWLEVESIVTTRTKDMSPYLPRDEFQPIIEPALSI